MECYMRKVTFAATLFVVLVAASVASAQGTVRGAQDGAEAGGQAAGPVGAVVGGAVGAATGTVGGISWSSTGPPPNASTSHRTWTRSYETSKSHGKKVGTDEQAHLLH
jgi:hypothetical protein